MLEHDEIPGQEELYQIAKEMNHSRNSALFVLTYLTGARISEVLKRVKKKNIKIRKMRGKDYIVIERLYTAKRKKHPLRNQVIPIHKEMFLWKIVQDYADTLKPDDILFPISYQRSWQILSKVISKYKEKSTTNKFMNACHYLRHCRNTHLVTIYDFNDQDLVKFNAWSDSKPATTYVHLRSLDIARKFD